MSTHTARLAELGRDAMEAFWVATVAGDMPAADDAAATYAAAYPAIAAEAAAEAREAYRLAAERARATVGAPEHGDACRESARAATLAEAAERHSAYAHARATAPDGVTVSEYWPEGYPVDSARRVACYRVTGPRADGAEGGAVILVTPASLGAWHAWRSDSLASISRGGVARCLAAATRAAAAAPAPAEALAEAVAR